MYNIESPLNLVEMHLHKELVRMKAVVEVLIFNSNNTHKSVWSHHSWFILFKRQLFKKIECVATVLMILNPLVITQPLFL